MTEPSAVPGPLTDLETVNVQILSRPAEDTEAADMVAAVNSLVPTWARPAGPGGTWAAHQRSGAALLAARLELRKNNPGGMQSFGLEGGAAYVSGNWPDVALLLGIGNYAVGRPG
jgi:hypothetical protein